MTRSDASALAASFTAARRRRVGSVACFSAPVPDVSSPGTDERIVSSTPCWRATTFWREFRRGYSASILVLTVPEDWTSIPLAHGALEAEVGVRLIDEARKESV